MPTIDIVKDCGAVLGNVQSNPQQIKANDDAVAKAIGIFEQAHGGVLFVDGLLLLSKEITWPTVTYNNIANTVVPMLIKGNGCDSRILWPPSLGKPGLTWVAQPTNSDIAPLGDWRCGVKDISFCGAGLKVSGGGKQFRVDNMSIINVQQPGQYALDVDTYDGGHLLGVNIHDCQSGAFRMVNSHHVAVDITGRQCNSGGVLFSCGDVYGSLYFESNRGRGIDVDGLRISNIEWWLEVNAGEFQGRMRNSTGNNFGGQMQLAGNQGWDLDPISQAANYFTPEIISASLPQSQGCVAGHTNFPSQQVQITSPAGSGKFTVQPSAWGNLDPNMWIELLTPTGNDIAGSWTPGDWFIVAFDVQCDDLTARWLASQSEAALRFWTNDPRSYQNFWMSGNRSQCTYYAPFAGNGTAQRVFMTPITNAAAPVAPPYPLSFTVTARVYFVPNSIPFPPGTPLAAVAAV